MAKRRWKATARIRVPGLGRIHAGLMALFLLACLATVGLLIDDSRLILLVRPAGSVRSDQVAVTALATGQPAAPSGPSVQAATASDQDLNPGAARGWKDLQRRLLRGILDQTIPLMGLQEAGPSPAVDDGLLNQAAVYVLGFRPTDPLSLLNAGVPLFGRTQVASGADSEAGNGGAHEEVVVPPPAEPSTPTVGTDPLILGDKGQIVVGVYSTHSSESFSPDLLAAGKPAQPNAYSSDLNYNVMRVGEELVRELHDRYGLGAVQIRRAHDADGYLGAYTRSATTVQDLLRDYPGLQMIIDLHRDSAARQDTILKVDGKDVARVMLIIGSGSKQLRQPNWQKNYAFARQVSAALEAQYPGLCRGIVVKADRYNQHFSPTVLLFEVGGQDNSLDEELRTARILAKVISGLVKKPAGSTGT
ncbi:MAG TPA: stage II sporulation protein P [Bacillota bacterium]